MRQRFTIAAVLAAFTGAMLVLAQAPRPGEVQLKAAQHKEQVEGDLKTAIEQYKKIAQSSDRRLAAKALVAIGECYEKLGSAEARAAYDRVVRDFPDQAESVGLARARLAALVSPPVHGGQTARQVWITRASDDPGEGSVSADGRYISFTDWETGDLGVRDVITGVGRHLTNTGDWEASGDYAEGSVISPDGRQVAYFWFDEKGKNELRVIPISGGTPRTVHRSDDRSDYIAPQGWTPDGRQLLVVHTLADHTSQIAMVSVQDGSLRALKSFTWQNLNARLSPNGRYIAYDSPKDDKTQARDIFVLGVDGSRETAVVQHSADDFLPQWSPDGSRILFLSDRTGTMSLWAIPLEDGKAQGPAELVKADVGRIRPLGMARNGTLHYVLPGASRTNIYTAELDGGKVSKKPALATEHFINSNTGPSLSPDGLYLAYYSLRAGSSTIVIRTLKTGVEKDIPVREKAGGTFGIGPKWFADARSLLVVMRETQRPGLGFYRVDLASGNAELLHHVNQDGFQGFTLTPDGKTIFYTQSGSSTTTITTRLMRFDIESHRETELKNDAWVISPTVSPDGKQVACVVSVRPGGASYVVIIPSTGGESREIFRGSPWMDGSRYNTLAWTPDQRYLLFVRGGVGDNTPNVLWRVPVAGGQPEQLGLSMMARLKSPQVHPDGRRIFFGAAENGPNEVWSLENFLPKTVAAK